MEALTHHAQNINDVTSRLQKIGLSKVPQAPNTYPHLNPLDIYRGHIAELLASVSGISEDIIRNALQRTATLEKGDLVIATPALRQKGKKPAELAKELAEKFPESPLVNQPTAADNYLQFFFKGTELANLVIPSILKSGPTFGFNPNLGLRDSADPSKGHKRLVIDFSSPNIAKPFHAGHLRSTIIGGFLANLYEAAGWQVTRLNYLGDWGKQYGVLAVGFEKFGSEKELTENPIGHLYDVYVKISKISADEKQALDEIKGKIAKGEGDTAALEAQAKQIEQNGVDEQARKYFKRMVDGESEAVQTWQRFRNLSIERYKATYDRLNIRYDDYSGESTVKDESMEEASRIMAEKSVSQESEGAIVVDLTPHSKKLGKALVRKKDGTSLYLTRDIGAAYERHVKYKFDKMIYVVASQQDLHFQQLFKIEELMGRKEISDKCQHINFGLVLGMSTRKGTAKFLDDILRDVGDHMHEVMRKNETKYSQVEEPEKTADVLGISAVMVQDMKGKRVNNYNFDMERMCSFEGDTGPYLQYAHARLCSIHRKAGVAIPSHSGLSEGYTPDESLLSADLSLLNEPHAVDLIRQLLVWPDVFLQTIKTQEPTTVLTYLFKMAHALSSSYDHLQVVGSEEKVMMARMALYSAARQVLANGMRLLGLNPVERM